MAEHTAPDPRPLRERVDAPAHVAFPALGDDLTWRPVTKADIPALLALARACDPIDNPNDATSDDEFDELFEMPTIDLTRDTVVALTTDGTAVAFGTVTIGEEHSTIVWVSLDGRVHPDRRGEGLGTALITWQEARGRQILATREESLPGWLSAFAEEHATWDIELLENNGFTPQRWWLELERPLDQPIDDVPLADDVRIEPFSEWNEQTRLAYNDSFRDHWGSQPVTAAEWERGNKSISARPDLSYVVIGTNADGTEEVAAFLLTEASEDDWEVRGYPHAYIELLGVRREWRGRKLAPLLLTHALRAYRAEGWASATLSVDSDSLTGAVGLYESVGFQTHHRSISYVREY